MKTAKLVIGIISIVLTFLVLFQSGIGDAMMNEGGTSGASGMLVGIMMLVSGIVAIAARKSKGGAIFCTVFYALAGLIGVSSSGIFKDLVIWGGLCLIFAVVFLVFSIKTQKEPGNSDKV